MVGSGPRMLLFVVSLLAAWTAELPAADADANPPQWTIEQHTDDPRYAAVAPTATNTNIDTVVLACEAAWRVLEQRLGILRQRYADKRL